MHLDGRLTLDERELVKGDGDAHDGAVELERPPQVVLWHLFLTYLNGRLICWMYLNGRSICEMHLDGRLIRADQYI